MLLLVVLTMFTLGEVSFIHDRNLVSLYEPYQFYHCRSG